MAQGKELYSCVGKRWLASGQNTARLQNAFCYHGVVDKAENTAGQSANDGWTDEETNGCAQHGINPAKQAPFWMDTNEKLPSEAFAEAEGRRGA